MTDLILAAAPQPGSIGGTGLVLASFGRTALIQTEHGALHSGISGRQLQVVCGDRVDWQRPAPNAAALITGVQRRINVLERIDNRGRATAVAANIGRLAVVVAPEPEPEWFVVDRYLAGAQLKDIPAAIIVNKQDLGLQDLHEDVASYRRLNVDCYEISTKDPSSLDVLRASIRGNATLLVGQSGVGKSSIINALIPDAAVQTTALSRDAEGRHTTSTARLYQLEPGSAIIDAPGVRDFAPPAAFDRAAERGFKEIHQASADCRFNDCRHFDEPDCAVRAGVASGQIAARRYESYRRLLRLFESFAPTR